MEGFQSLPTTILLKIKALDHYTCLLLIDELKINKSDSYTLRSMGWWWERNQPWLWTPTQCELEALWIVRRHDSNGTPVLPHNFHIAVEMELIYYNKSLIIDGIFIDHIQKFTNNTTSVHPLYTYFDPYYVFLFRDISSYYNQSLLHMAMLTCLALTRWM